MQGASRKAGVGSIYSRLNGLLNSKIVKYEERPVWFDVYKAFPPKREPVYRAVIAGDEVPSFNPPKILYYEDQIRAKFYSEIEDNEIHDLNENNKVPIDRIFIKTFYELEAKGISSKNLFKATVEVMKEKGYFIKLKMNIKRINHHK